MQRNTLPSIPRTREELERLVAAQTPESLHLDYKDSRALLDSRWKDELSKDASAFANSDGGLIVFGIVEKGRVPVRVDEGVAGHFVWPESARR